MQTESKDRVRPPAVAGLFYPADARELDAVVHRYLAEARKGGEPPAALIAPHAGYIYSGPVAASAYALLSAAPGRIRRVLVLGPSHQVAFRGLAAPTATYFATPLGEIPVDREALEGIAHLPQVLWLDEAHGAEHSVEVHLPFLQTVLGPFQLIPLVVGDAGPEEVAEVIEALWDGPQLLPIVSSDLSHYHDYASARALDAATSRAIEALRPEAIGYEQACGRNPLNGLLTVARRRSLRAETVDLRNSGDTAGPRDHVVGYGAYVFH
ncbi:hypothetical protein BMS3Bbin12_00945 [bacterium BMS3Bbin12]|nr:hypothetical protein BMS3Abin12_02184 [bacterium BMS3Abin12]GBE47778.1 hypothetical protein BMS3Bbin12_00945 [bacterium BMS3Bbin12]GBE49888.1 hypothetical protein BMS3Bbin13_00813 [bacterium BMS3Bbin13]HDJ86753.1 AmmeMemoRadiSam system protein B [Chromatiales bacterium]HDK03463.1 AmmeMemoRadiSam system protein B [Gammaproteobacteria bacterium]